MLLAVDPGANSGWAVFDSCRRLTACGLYDGDRYKILPEVEPGSRVLIECPRLRPSRFEKNPNSILLVARSAGEWGGRLHHCQVEYLLPNDWKGSASKDIDHRRTFGRLAPEELRALVTGCSGLSPRSAPIDRAVRVGLSEADKRANVLDAIGIGLFGVGR
jgi:hypothetical protein